MKNLGGRWQPAQIQARPPGQPALRSTPRGQMRVAVRAYPEPSAPDAQEAPDARTHATARDAMAGARAARSAPDEEAGPGARAHATARDVMAMAQAARSAPDEEAGPGARAHATAWDAMAGAQAARSAPDEEVAPDAQAHATARELRAEDAVRAAAGPAGRRHRPAARLALPASPVLCHPKRPAAEQPPSTAAQPQTEFQPTASFESPFPGLRGTLPRRLIARSGTF
jgi:hypothetical protein